MTKGLVQAGYSRVWRVPRGAGPWTTPEYLACAKVGDPSQDFGDVKRVECPDPNQYGQYIIADEIRGALGNVEFDLTARYSFDKSELLAAARERCEQDIHILLGKCKTPNDYKSGWEKMLIVEHAYLKSWATENLGALESGDNNPTNEKVAVSGIKIYEVLPLAFANLCAATVVRELVSVDVCDSPSCGGDCGPYSGGCDDVLAVQLGTGATPGTLPAVIYSSDGGATCASADITTMYSNESPEDAECVGDEFVVIESTLSAWHYAKTADILAGTPSWTKVMSGSSDGLRAIWSADSAHTWIVGDNGLVVFTDDLSTGTVQGAGVTVQNLRDVHGVDTFNVVAVGALNAVIYTRDGGETWSAVAGPSAGVGLNTVLAISDRTWLVGTAGGKLYWTDDYGATWTEISLPGSLTAVDDIQAATKSVLYLAGRTGASGKILRSTAGGAAGTWYVLPETGGAALVANDRINSLAVCADPNVVYGAGLADNGTDGVLVKAA